MEVLVRVFYKCLKVGKLLVLILVLVEVLVRVETLKSKESRDLSLNPCFSGSTSKRVGLCRWRIFICVLILVLVEVLVRAKMEK